MSINEIGRNIVNELSEKRNPERVLFMRTMAPSTMEMLGITNPHLKDTLKRWLPELKKFPPELWIELAKQLVDTHIFECNQLAFELLWKNKKALSLITLHDIEHLGKNMDNWATVDALAVMISGWAWREKHISDEDVLHWQQSENRWWRRLALVSTIPLNMKSRGGKGDATRTLMICELAVNDRNDLIVKALSWALRELSKIKRESVIDFMKKHEAKLAARVRKEVNTKLETGKKNV